jgi:thiol-disulfide isomerase/thioredoxin
MTLDDLQGQPQTLDPEALGKPVLLYFWSVYCPNCKEAIPDLVEMARSKDENTLAIWAVNVDGERHGKAVRGYVKNLALPFLVVFDRLEGEYLVAADPLGASKTPTLYLADPAGKILLRQVIEIDLSAVTAALAELHP